jgi:general secretion pathway protein F
MPVFQTRVLRAGAVSAERVEAPDRAAVAAVLGVAPQHVLEAREVAAAEGARPWRRKARFPLQLFSQELAVLLDAGIALLEALNTLREKEGQPGVRVALDGVIAQIEQGQPLSVALRQQPQAFDELICAIVAANERTGQLSTALAQHARYLGWVDALRSRLVAALVYPLMLLGVGSAVILFLLLYVLPRFAGILEQTSADLPWASRVLIEFGQTAGAHPGLVIGGITAVAFAIFSLLRQPAVRQRAQSALWTLPGLGPRLRVLALARLYRSLAMLLASGVPALAALTWSPRRGVLPCRPRLRRSSAASGCPPPSTRRTSPRRWRAACCAWASVAVRSRACWSALRPSTTRRPRG